MSIKNRYLIIEKKKFQHYLVNTEITVEFHDAHTKINDLNKRSISFFAGIFRRFLFLFFNINNWGEEKTDPIATCSTQPVRFI